ncbi:heterokaryon incompatibility protein-domain-containing protein [Bipolaris maydis]|nr:heterokaryon incompatibility protein-domain-containing protein [Bipolaris maydis]
MGFTTRQKTRQSPTTPQPLPFTYEPLNYSGGFIRLLKFLPQLSNTGLIQCEIWHAHVSSRYTCLSYVWGPPGNEQDVLINGKIAKVRKNLKDFMEVARKKYAASSRAFWIDAVCIDQGNDLERTHQVAQMSKIYPRAEEVVGWLGYSDRIERTFVFWRELNALKPKTYHDTQRIWINHLSKRNKELRKDWNELAEQTYWTRAWITQEILLARKLKLLVNDSEIEPTSTPGIAQLLPDRSSSMRSLDMVSTQVFHAYLGHLSGSDEMMGLNLISLIRSLSTREASQPRDLIISLLSVVQNADSIAAACNKSNVEMFLDLLDMFPDSLCPCATSYLANALDLKLTPKTFANSPRDPSFFALPIKPANVLPTFHFNPADTIASCTHCQSDVPDLGLDWLPLCMSTFSGCTHGSHIYLSKRHIANSGTKHVIKGGPRHPELEVCSVEEDDATMGYTLYLSATTLMTLFSHSAETSSFHKHNKKKWICSGPAHSRTSPCVRGRRWTSGADGSKIWRKTPGTKEQLGCGVYD